MIGFYSVFILHERTINKAVLFAVYMQVGCMLVERKCNCCLFVRWPVYESRSLAWLGFYRLRPHGYRLFSIVQPVRNAHSTSVCYIITLQQASCVHGVRRTATTYIHTYTYSSLSFD